LEWVVTSPEEKLVVELGSKGTSSATEFSDDRIIVHEVSVLGTEFLKINIQYFAPQLLG
jgi:hypothetical protein